METRELSNSTLKFFSCCCCGALFDNLYDFNVMRNSLAEEKRVWYKDCFRDNKATNYFFSLCGSIDFKCDW